MKLAVLSDTHLRLRDPALLARLGEVFAGAEMILHAGDLTSLEVLSDLESLGLGPVTAVAGNMDPPAVTAALPFKRTLKIQGHQIGLIHGWGSPLGLAGRVRQEFERVEAIVYGHSHRPNNTWKNGILYFNPGSALRSRLGRPSVGLLSVGKKISGRIVRL